MKPRLHVLEDSTPPLYLLHVRFSQQPQRPKVHLLLQTQRLKAPDTISLCLLIRLEGR